MHANVTFEILKLAHMTLVTTTHVHLGMSYISLSLFNFLLITFLMKKVLPYSRSKNQAGSYNAYSVIFSFKIRKLTTANKILQTYEAPVILKIQKNSDTKMESCFDKSLTIFGWSSDFCKRSREITGETNEIIIGIEWR